ncbi:hypothetical protein HY090_02770 [Candidatus Kaiserbacteria bacterium]|nr:hypothetical protein [Candidatus Kaiserbacteria bacterium]
MRRVFLIAFFLIVPLFASAELIPTYGTLQLSIRPQYPAPHETVTLTASNAGSNGGETYIWSVDDTIVLQGIGEKTLVLPAGDSGSTQTVSLITVDEAGNPQGVASMLIRPADIDLVWEAKTAVPPFYTGRPLPNGASAITLLAIPHIILNDTELPTNALIYTWQVNGIPFAGSGYGKSSVTITPPLFGTTFTVSVHAETPDGAGAADGITAIIPQTPEALLYENTPLLGIRFEKLISGTFALSGEEISLTAFPIFTQNPDALSYQWSLDGQPFAVSANAPRDVTLRKVGEGSGTHAVTFSFTNPQSFLENGAASFKLVF